MSIQKSIKDMKTLELSLEREVKKKVNTQEDFDNMIRFINTIKSDMMIHLTDIENSIKSTHLANTYGTLDYERLGNDIKKLSVDHFINGDTEGGMSLSSLSVEITSFIGTKEGMPPERLREVSESTGFNLSGYVKEEVVKAQERINILIEQKDDFDLTDVANAIESISKKLLIKYNPNINICVDSPLAIAVLNLLVSIFDLELGEESYQFTLYIPTVKYPSSVGSSVLERLVKRFKSIPMKLKTDRSMPDVLANTKVRFAESKLDGLLLLFGKENSFSNELASMKKVIKSNKLKRFDFKTYKVYPVA